MALELGVPLVATAAAAAPFRAGAAAATAAAAAAAATAATAATAAAAADAAIAVADDAAGFASSVLRLYTQPAEWKAGGAAARARFRDLLANDPAEADVRGLIRQACGQHGGSTRHPNLTLTLTLTLT